MRTNPFLKLKSRRLNKKTIVAGLLPPQVDDGCVPEQHLMVYTYIHTYHTHIHIEEKPPSRLKTKFDRKKWKERKKEERRKKKK
jgi:hypothetical protein